MKRALANCFHEIQQNNRRSDVTEQNVKELVKLQNQTNRLLAELSSKIDKWDKVKERRDGPSYNSMPFKTYCSFCQSSDHDLGSCKDKEACFRCGEFNHQEDTCFWKERSCHKCNEKGHRKDMHEAVDPDVRAALVRNYPKAFLHFFGGVEGGRNQNRGRGGTRYRGGDGRQGKY